MRDGGANKTNWDEVAASECPNFFKQIYFHKPLFKAYWRLLKKASFFAPISIVELGAGTGYTNLCLADILPVKKITVVDTSPDMLNIARRVLSRLCCQKEFLQRDLLTLETKEKFDLVHSGGVIEHFSDQERKKLLDLHAKLTLRGGYCIIFVPTPTTAYNLTRRFSEIVGRWPFVDERPIEEEQLKREIMETGLKILGTTRFWKYHLTEVGIISQKEIS